MEPNRNTFTEVSGLIMVICALAIVIIHVNLGKNLDAFILPFILLMNGIIFLFRKPAEASREIRLSPRKRLMVIAALSIPLFAAIVTMIITLF